jgi:hypothetical protein
MFISCSLYSFDAVVAVCTILSDSAVHDLYHAMDSCGATMVDFNALGDDGIRYR